MNLFDWMQESAVELVAEFEHYEFKQAIQPIGDWSDEEKVEYGRFLAKATGYCLIYLTVNFWSGPYGIMALTILTIFYYVL